MKKILLIFVTVIAVSLFIFNLSSTTKVKIGDTYINVTIADSVQERNQGLSGRKELKNDEGMLFVFERAGTYGFWMKDMNFAIDIVWIGEDKRVLGIEKNIEPVTYPKVFYPPSEVKYVLEVPATFSDTNSLSTGQTLSTGL